MPQQSTFMTPKYVIFNGLHAIMLAPTTSHADAKIGDGDMKATGAGFFEIFVNESGKADVRVFGESDTLGLKSKPWDAHILKMILGLNKKEIANG